MDFWYLLYEFLYKKFLVSSYTNSLMSPLRTQVLEKTEASVEKNGSLKQSLRIRAMQEMMDDYADSDSENDYAELKALRLDDLARVG
jgi:hypothetical protein